MRLAILAEAKSRHTIYGLYLNGTGEPLIVQGRGHNSSFLGSPLSAEPQPEHMWARENVLRPRHQEANFICCLLVKDVCVGIIFLGAIISLKMTFFPII